MKKPSLALPLILLIGPAALLVMTFIVYAVVNFITTANDGGGMAVVSTIVNVVLFLVGTTATIAFIPCLVMGIILLANRTKQQRSGVKDRRGLGIAALITGIVGVVFAWIPVLGIVLTVLAIVFGAVALKSSARGQAIAGLVLGVVGTAIAIISFIAIVIVSYNGVTQAAADNGLKSQVSSVASAVLTYQTDNRGMLPTSGVELDQYLPAEVQVSDVSVVSYENDLVVPADGFLVVTGGLCYEGEEEATVSQGGPRDYAVVTELSNGEFYCSSY